MHHQLLPNRQSKKTVDLEVVEDKGHWWEQSARRDQTSHCWSTVGPEVSVS